MPSPPVSVFLTTIASQPALRQRQEYILRILQVKKIPFTSYDLASDEEAKRLWKRKAPPGQQQLPGILVGGKFPGTFQDFEEAVEYGELDRFLRLSETWRDDSDEETSTRPKLPPAKPIGVPGAMLPLQMTPDHLKKKILAKPPDPTSGEGSDKRKEIPMNKKSGLMDMGDELSGYGLQGVKVTENELLDLVRDLGLDDDAAGDLVKGLGGSGESRETEEKEMEGDEVRHDVKEVETSKDVKEGDAEDEAKGSEAVKEIKESSS